MGLNVTMALGRALFLFLLSEYYVGRLDTPFVSNGVGRYFGGYIDLEPFYHWVLTAIVSVEAHRHPYIETLGAVYLTKLKHTNKFNNRIGIKWRTVFVSALMPWLAKYRIRRDTVDEDAFGGGESIRGDENISVGKSIEEVL